MTEQIVVAEQVLLNDAGGTVLSPGAVTIADGVIQSVEAVTGSRPRGEQVVDLGESVIMPGLVNAHAHTPMSLMRGVAEGHSLLTLEGWFGTIRSLEAHLTPELVDAAVAVSCAEMIGSGTTTFADQYFYADRYLPIIQESGLRAAVAYGIVELGDDAARATGLAAAESFLAAAQGHPLVQGWIGPHAFFVDNQLDAIEAELEMTHRYGAGLHTHYATSGEEDVVSRERYGVGSLQKMAEIGLLEVPLLLAHSNDVPVDELDRLAGTSATIVAAASVAMMSGAGAPPIREALDAGVNVAIGTDNLCADNNADMFEELRTMAKLAAFVGKTPNSVTPTEVLGMATWRGHRALGGGPDDGRIVPGAVADLLGIPIAALHRGPTGAQSLVSAIVFGVSGFDTSHVMTAGRWLKRDGALTTIDLPTAFAQRQRDYDTLMSRVAAAN